MKALFTAIPFTLIIAACATGPKPLPPEDQAAFKTLDNKHMKCLGEKTALYINGSDDVAFLTKHISSLCNHVLAQLNDEILSRGYSAAYAAGYVNAGRQEGEKITTSFILRKKAENAK